MGYCIEKVEEVLSKKLEEAANHFGSRELKIIDLGVFPWHKLIELSFLFSDDDADEDDIAAWPNYDYSKFNEGQWVEAEELTKEIGAIWEQDCDAIPIFLDFGSALTGEKVTKVLELFNLAPDFRVQVLNPDDSNSENYCE